MDKTDTADKKFGTFGGVFTPSLLTILGVIMFMRFAPVTGHAGLWHTLGILAAAKAISVITGLSIASIATNMRVKGGGAYYLASRSLGAEFGGVIAVFFYVAQAAAVSMYVAGFTEAIFSAVPDMGLSFRATATLTNLAVFACVYIGAGWTIRVQYGILVVLALSLASFFAGAAQGFSPEILKTNLDPDWTSGHSPFTLFALFFPAVTGIMAGVNLSGDLKDPSHAIPRGVFAAIAVSGLIYTAITILLAGSVPRADLAGPGFVMKDRALFPVLIYAGVICATISSAIGSMMGAPRILQAFARDRIFPRLGWFAKGSGPSDEPRRAIILTFLIAQAGVMAGDLDAVAPIISMFFLITYAAVNLACFYESISKNPSFRPTFQLNHWSVALFGALGCLGVMFLIHFVWALAAIIFAAALYFLIARAKIIVRWGDLDSGLAYQRARKALLRLELERYHPKNWRPAMLVLSGRAGDRLHLAEYAFWLCSKRGVVSIGQVIPGRLDELIERRREAEILLRKFIRKAEIPAFPAVIVEENIHAAIKALLQCHGIGGIRPNTVLLAWRTQPHQAGMFSESLSIVKRMKRSLIIVACEGEEEEKKKRGRVPDGAINVWWSGPQNGSLALMLAFLLKENREWRDHPFRVIRPAAPKADVENMEKEMRKTLAEGRIDAEIVIARGENPIDAVRMAMGPSAVLFAGFEPADEDPFGALIPRLQEIVDLPGDVILVYNAGDVSLSA
jgi:amino acid transporter